jgi:hypothetical protein
VEPRADRRSNVLRQLSVRFALAAREELSRVPVVERGCGTDLARQPNALDQRAQIVGLGEVVRIDDRVICGASRAESDGALLRGCVIPGMIV